MGNRFRGWLTAWLNLPGLITVPGAITIGTAFFFQGTFGGLAGMTTSAGHIVTFVAVITIMQALFNHLGIRVTTFLTGFSGYVIFATTAVLVVALINYNRRWISRGCVPLSTFRAKRAAVSSRKATACRFCSC
ncbi:MAG: APC family permease [Rhodobacter sp.]|nr:APC family permease [Rhodobacter sp.]